MRKERETPDFTESIIQFWPIDSDTASTCFCTKCGHSASHPSESNYGETLQNIRSGLYPSDSERSVLFKLLEDAHRCQMELDRLPDVPAQLEMRKMLVRSYTYGLQSIMSPIRKLPQELLVEILNLIVSGYDYDIPNQIYSHRYSDQEYRLPVFALAHVCVRWYQLVHNTPALWSSVRYQHIGRHNPLFHLFLDRSRSHPISFYISAYDAPAPDEDLTAVITTKNCFRWQRAALQGTEPFIRGLLRPLSVGGYSLPELISLIIAMSSNRDGPLEFPIQCPRLESLTLHHVCLNLRFTYPSVRHLSVHGISSEQAHQLIGKCPDIRNLSLNEIDVPSNKLGELVVCHNLRTLRMDFGPSDHEPVAVLLDTLSMPSLLRLELVDAYLTNHPYTIDSLCSLLTRSRISLTRLSIQFIPFTGRDLLRLLPLVSSVTEFEYEEFEGQWKEGERLLQMLIAPPRGHHEWSDGNEESGNQSDLFESELSGGNGFPVPLGHGSVGEDFAVILGEEKRCLLPRLKDLHLKISAHSDTMIKVLRSRWRPNMLSRSTDSQALDEEECVCLEKARVEIFGCGGKKLWLESERLSGEDMDVTVSFHR